MTTHNSNDPEILEKLYQEDFTPLEGLDADDESISLKQPSELKIVESITTYGISEDLLIHKG